MTQPTPPKRLPPTETPAAATPGPTATRAEPAPSYPAAPELSTSVPVEERPFTADAVPTEGEQIEVSNDLYTAILTTRGAAIERWELAKFDEGPSRGHAPVVLTTGQPPLQDAMITPLRELGRGDLSRELFAVESNDAEGIVFGLLRDGVYVRKAYTFANDSYAFRLRLEVTNQSGAPVVTEFGVGWSAQVSDAPDFKEQALVALHRGSVEREDLRSFGRPGFFGSFTGEAPTRKVGFDGEVDWAGVGTNYFLSVLLPDSPTQARARFYVVEPGKTGVVEVSFPAVHIPSGQTVAREFRGYAGPKEIERLEALGGQTIRSIDLGWSWVAPLTRAFTWLLARLVAVIGNYGWSIIPRGVALRQPSRTVRQRWA